MTTVYFMNIFVSGFFITLYFTDLNPKKQKTEIFIPQEHTKVYVQNWKILPNLRDIEGRNLLRREVTDRERERREVTDRETERMSPIGKTTNLIVSNNSFPQIILQFIFSIRP